MNETTGVFDGFGDVLRWLRKRSGLSQDRVAALAGVSVKAIGHYESGRVDPPLERLSRLLEIYGVSSFRELADAAEKASAEATGLEVKEGPMLYDVTEIDARDAEIARLRAELDEANRAVRRAVLGAGMISVGRDEG